MDEHRRYRERRIEAQKRARAARKRRRIKIAAACGAALCAAVGIGVFAGNSLFSEGDMAVDTMASVSTESNEAAAADQSLEATSSIPELLAAMIQQSDNESYNELVRLESADQSFSDGCHILNDYLETAGYTDTRIYHTLSPSATESESISDIQNHTSVEDCGAILEKIYEGTCISQEASEEMLELLLGQQTVTKIPAGLPEGVEVANKTGETEESQHDAAIIFGEETDYILCVMSAEWSVSSQAVETIQTISQAVYEYLNM